MKEFSKLINNLDDNVIELNRELIIERVSLSFLKHIQSAGSNLDPIGKQLFELLPIAADLKQYFDTVMTSGNMVQFERNSPNPALNMKFLITLIPLKDTAKNVIGILFISHTMI